MGQCVRLGVSLLILALLPSNLLSPLLWAVCPRTSKLLYNCYSVKMLFCFPNTLCCHSLGHWNSLGVLSA